MMNATDREEALALFDELDESTRFVRALRADLDDLSAALADAIEERRQIVRRLAELGIEVNA